MMKKYALSWDMGPFPSSVVENSFQAQQVWKKTLVGPLSATDGGALPLGVWQTKRRLYAWMGLFLVAGLCGSTVAVMCQVWASTLVWSDLRFVPIHSPPSARVGRSSMTTFAKS